MSGQIGHLLKIEAWGDTAAKMYKIETESLLLQNERLKNEIGRMKRDRFVRTLLTTGVVVLSAGATYGIVRGLE